MQAFVKLTQVQNLNRPDEVPTSCYLDPSRILVITREEINQRKEGSEEANRQALEILHQEVHRVGDELGAIPTLTPEDEHQAKSVNRWAQAKDGAASLMAAYSEVSRTAAAPSYHKPIECTVVQLACGTGLEHGVMLARVYVRETPDEVVQLIGIALGWPQ